MKQAKAKRALRFVAGAVILAGLMALLSSAAEAAKPTTKATAKTAVKTTGKKGAELSTRHSFSGSRVGGQYQVPAEATAKIENEKPLEELLGLRTQFRDRAKQDSERR